MQCQLGQIKCYRRWFLGIGLALAALNGHWFGASSDSADRLGSHLTKSCRTQDYTSAQEGR